MQDRIVAPVWQNRDIHLDFESWDFHMRCMPDPAAFVDVGGHGCTVDPVTLQVEPIRRYRYSMRAKNCMLRMPTAKFDPVAFLEYQGGHNPRILYGDPTGLRQQPIDGTPSSPDPASDPIIRRAMFIKTEQFNHQTTAVVCENSLHLIREDRILRSFEKKTPAKIEAIAPSPFIVDELVTIRGNSVGIEGDSRLCLETKASSTRDVSLWTHPRHVAIATNSAINHTDLRTGSFVGHIETDSPNFMPKESLKSISLSPLDVNQMFAVSSDSLSIWDVRYPSRALGMYNHFVARTAEMQPLQTLKLGSLFVLVRSSDRCTLFEFEEGASTLNPTQRSLQLQLGRPTDAGHLFTDQTGETLDEKIWTKLKSPIVGSCIHAKGESLRLLAVSAEGDWYSQEFVKDDSEGSKERTYAFSIDCKPLDERQVKELQRSLKPLIKDIEEEEARKGPSFCNAQPLSITMNFPVRKECGLCAASGAGFCEECGALEECDSILDSFKDGGMIKMTKEFSEDEDRRCRELLSAKAGGYTISDGIRAAWGDMEWGASMTEAGEERTAGMEADEEDDDQPQEEDGYDD